MTREPQDRIPPADRHGRRKSRHFHRLPHIVAFLGIALGAIWLWLRDHGGDLFFAFALVNAIGAAALSLHPDSAAAYAVGLHSFDVPNPAPSAP